MVVRFKARANFQNCPSCFPKYCFIHKLTKLTPPKNPLALLIVIRDTLWHDLSNVYLERPRDLHFHISNSVWTLILDFIEMMKDGSKSIQTVRGLLRVGAFEHQGLGVGELRDFDIGRDELAVFPSVARISGPALAHGFSAIILNTVSRRVTF